MNSRFQSVVAWIGLFGTLAIGCGEADRRAPAVFPPEYAQTYVEMRNCRRSIDHQLVYVRILVDPVAYEAYFTRFVGFPEGAVVLKAEYDDEACTELIGFTAMRKEAAGYNPDGGDWRWQTTTASGRVTEDGTISRCIGCHEVCGAPPDGYAWTCSVP